VRNYVAKWLADFSAAYAAANAARRLKDTRISFSAAYAAANLCAESYN